MEEVNQVQVGDRWKRRESFVLKQSAACLCPQRTAAESSPSSLMTCSADSSVSGVSHIWTKWDNLTNNHDNQQLLQVKYIDRLGNKVQGGMDTKAKGMTQLN